ncbi:MAG: insulinase family protein [Flavobacteriaceae bacterium]|nr:insulinase family protein [Flavobacteriaceae bacterium]
MKTKLFSIILAFVSIGMIAQIDRTKQPKSGASPVIKLKTPVSFELKNGLKVLIVENHKLPTVTISMSLDNKPFALGNKKGVKSLLGGLLGAGSTNMSKTEFDEEIDFLGASIGFSSQSGYMTTLTKHLPKVLDMFADSALNPLFSQDEFDKLMKQNIEGIKSGVNSVKAIASRNQSFLTYGSNHPFGEFDTEEKMSKITLADVKDYYAKYFLPNNAYMVITGDVNPKKIKKQIKKLFKKWKKADLEITSLPVVNDVAKTEINFINMANAVQSEIAVINTVTLKKGDSDYFAALLANKILGGGGTARLFMNLREDKAFTYGAYSSLGASRYISRFKASASVRNEVTDSAVVAFLEEIKNIRDLKVSEEELKNAKAEYLGKFIMATEEPSVTAGYALDIKINNLPADYYEKYIENINAVTVEQIQAVANKYIKADNLRIVIVGKGSDVVNGLETLPYEIKYFDKKGNPIEKPVFSLDIPEGVTVETIMDASLKAMDPSSKVKSISYKYKAEMQGQVLELDMKTKAPNKLSVSMSMMGMVMSKQVFNGTIGYNEAQGQNIPFTQEQLDEYLASSFPFNEISYKKTATLSSFEMLDGKKVYLVKTKKTKTVFYDSETFFKVKEVEVQKGPGGQEMETIVMYSDYKEVDGVMIPHTYKMFFGPQEINFELVSATINAKIEDKVFE